MKYAILQFFKKALAVVMSAIMTLTGGIFGDKDTPDKNRPDANTVTSYNTQTADYSLSIDAEDEIHDISDLLFGIFFEDINFAADGGLYAEMVANRSFEYTEIAAGDSLYAWSAVGGADLKVINDKSSSLNENNTSYLTFANNSNSPAGVANRGFLDGMAVEKDSKYNFSVYAKALDGYTGSIYVKLCVGDKTVGEDRIENITDEWAKYELSFACDETASANVTLQVLADKGSIALDMISFFPDDTFKGRKNGMRKDLGEILEELEPKFLRFPGGCVIEGYDYETAYNWKDSIATGSNGLPLEFDGGYGDIAARKQGINLWTNIAATDDPNPCFMSYGLGFFECFQLAEDIGAVGVPVINCGLYCQMRGRGPVDMESDEFKQYIQDMHDLVEFCRGDVNSTWGKVRASLGHPEPFELKYIGIGNEQEGEVYFERYQAFLDSFNAAKSENPQLYEGLELIYSSGASDGTHSGQYLPSYEYAKEQLGNSDNATDFAGATDHHYYNEPSWFFKNADYYDENNYKRSVDEMTDTIYGGGIQVFLGEYAARSNRLSAVLAEAAYMTGLERNGDIVRMAAYAPLFGNLTATHWSPDLIWFNNHQVTGSISYYVQKLFSVNQGTKLLKSMLDGAKIEQKPLQGRIGIGTWYTSAEFDNIKITDNETGEVLGEQKFYLPTDFWWNWDNVHGSKDFKIQKGKLVQTNTWMPYSDTGMVAYFGCDDWSDYTYTLEATKLDGEEGFIIPFAVKDKQNCYFWNIGGWGNTVSALQQIENGVKTGQVNGTQMPFTAETGKTYNLKIVISGTQVKCYIDDVLYVDYDFASEAEAEAYHVVSTDETGDIIVKIVNTTETSRVFAVDIKNADIKSSATVHQVAGDSLDNDNILGAEEDCIMEEFTVDGFSESFNYTVPAYSVTCIRLERN
ncbi:MAG: carbohydrate binding domain-containing protein [Clostridia bacterium]|nr:carbohydrate binding domain-containing protein [Clostridia bacterium]